MSHTIQIKQAFKDFNILKKTFESLGWQIKEKTKIKNYGYDNKVYQYAAINPKKGGMDFDIGISYTDGKIELFSDFYGGSIESLLGKDLCNLKKQYALKVIEDEFFFTGGTINQTQNLDGTITVEVEEN